MPRAVPSRFVLRSRLAEVGRMHDWLDGVFAARDTPAALAHAVRLCLEEAASNIVLHGYGSSRAGMVAVALAWRGTRIFASVVDSAPAFDPLVARPPAADGTGGYGLLLARHYATACRYERRAGRNRLLLGFGGGAPTPP